MDLNWFGSDELRNKNKPKSKRPVSAASADCERYQRLGCDGCPLASDELKSPKMKPTGSKRPVIYILGEAPGRNEDERCTQFVGSSGEMLRDAIRDAGFDESELRWNNCCRCRPYNNRTPSREEIERCRPSVVRDIEKTKPTVVVLVGGTTPICGTTLSWALPREKNTERWYGKLVPVKIGKHVCWGYAIIHPLNIKRGDKSDWHTVLRFALKRLRGHVLRPLCDPPMVTPESIHDGVSHATDARSLGQMAAQLLKWGKSRAAVGFDVETSGLRPYALADPLDGLLSIAMSSGEITWAVPVSHSQAMWSPDERKHVVKMVLSFLRSRAVKIAHNLPFELEWLTAIYGHEPPWCRKRWGDTMAQAYVLDERKGVHSLDHCILQRFGFPLKAQSNIDRARIDDANLGDVLAYNALDAKYTAKLYEVQSRELDDNKLQSVYELHLARAFTLVKSQQAGLVVDLDLVDQFRDEQQAKIEKCIRALNRSEESKLYLEKTGKLLTYTPMQLAKLFRDILKRPEGSRGSSKSGYSVDDESLTSMKLPFAKKILEMRRAIKLKSTYLDGCARGGKYLYPDGRLHSKFNDIFTATGRLSAEDPNVQNWPKRENAWVRSIVVCPPRHVMLSADYGQIEYRVIGIASKDKHICDSLRDRYDVHMAWAERVAEIDPKVWRAHGKDMKKLRTAIKGMLVFPAFYGAKPDYIARLIGMDQYKCRDLFDEFWEEFSGVHAWQRRLLKEYERDGYVSCLTGRRRRAPLTDNMIYNTPIQGSASDIVVDAMNRLSIRSDREQEPALQPILNVHDDLTFYVPKKRKDELMEIIVDEMLSPSFDWVTVPISVEVSVGDNWGDLKAVDTFYSDERGKK